MMDPNYSQEVPQFSVSHIKYHLPYFTPAEVDQLADKQRGRLSVTQEEKIRQQACGFIEAVGAKIGFPRKTIATAQNLYHRFHLYFQRKDFSYYDVALAALYVSSKMHDTLKKPREILMVAYAVRFPELAAKSKSVAGEIDMDPATVEHDRQRLLAVERLILETVSFNFTSRLPFPYVIKAGKALRASKKLTKLAWRLAIDSYRSLVNLEYPPHVVALGCLYLAASLSSFEQAPSPARPGYASSAEIAATLGQYGQWEKQFQAHVQDLEEIAFVVIDLLVTASQNALANTSPVTPSSPSPHTSRSQHRQALAQAQPPPVPYKTDQLIRLKILMREHEHPPRQWEIAVPRYEENEASLLGRNEGTVRFLFGPPDVADGGF
ncbi:cyclin-like protein [Laetiporus sulphureus 93-53]|uniref:Cyclin-like protein n=1 Tax=Laetiporus sulphureus 93-53 TaxID=1314785 RepID=A0A165HLR1_9APHY|nr:cyclin-like protein [Laetiporus sulphureus 93-53]KZT11898.1 cyclin-like protein [Laetiporus sulphureus 93-53]